MLAYLRKVIKSAKDEGASAVEYALLVTGIAVAIAAAVFLLNGALSTSLNKTSNCLNNSPTSGNCV
jgi:pilus assembly protein Flp/PilA